MNENSHLPHDSILLSLNAEALNQELRRVEAEAKALRILLRAAAARDLGKRKCQVQQQGGARGN